MLLKSWIDSGASAPVDEQPESSQHWAFIAPARPPIPQLSNRNSQIVNPIDAYIFARLEREGIAPSPEADRVTLLRRLSLDLTGLPPTPGEVDEFLGDKRPGAYERRDADFRFHRTLAEASGNRILTETLEPLVRRALLVTTVGFPQGRSMRSYQEHREILATLRRRDAEAAKRAMMNHLQNALRFGAQLWERP